MKHIDILILTKTKLDEAFLISQFLMDGFSTPYRFDRNKHGGAVMVYVERSGYFVERIILPLKLMNITLIILTRNSNYKKVLLVGDFNIEITEHYPESICNSADHSVYCRPRISRIFEKLMQKQINGYINKFLPPYLCSYRKGFSTQLA